MQPRILPIAMSVMIVMSILSMVNVQPIIPRAEAANPTFSTGDVFVAVGNSKVQWRHADGTLNKVIDCSPVTSSTYTTGMTFDGSGNLYVTMFDGNAVCIVDPTGTPIGTFGTGYNADPESILFDASNNVYVGQANGNGDILKFDSSGTLLDQFDVATQNRGSDWIDLAADQCTMYYTSEGTAIKRYDVCNDTQLPDFTTGLHGPAFALRILGNGNVLVADSQDIHLLDSNGNIIKTYDAPGEDSWFALNLDPDGKSFWSAAYDTSNVYKFDIDTGAILLNFNTGTNPNTVFGLAVFGEVTQARYQLTLDPTSAVNDVGSSHTVTATLTLGGSPVSGATVEFDVMGANPASGSDITDVNGQATFTYTGNNAGLDTITVTAKVNGIAVAVATATKEWKVTGLEIKKLVEIHDKGFKVDEMITKLQDAQIVEATLIDPNNKIYVYHNIPKTIPANIPWNDPAWTPGIQFFDGEWQLKLQIIAFYEDPKTGEIKEVEQKIIINFQVMNNEIVTIKNQPLELHKEIIIDPHPAQLNGKIDITIGEDISPSVNNVFVAELTITKPSGTVVSYTNIPIDITASSATIPFPSTDWNAEGANPTVALDEAGLYELDIEIIAFYNDGTVGIHKVNQKLWVSFNVIPESAIGAVAIIGASIAISAVYAYRKKGVNN